MEQMALYYAFYVLIFDDRNRQMHLILLSSIGAGESVCVVPSEITPVIRQQLKTHTEIEHLVRSSGMWCLFLFFLSLDIDRWL
jgi:hypothetical protein